MQKTYGHKGHRIGGSKRMSSAEREAIRRRAKGPGEDWAQGLPAEKGRTQGDQDPESDPGNENASRPEPEPVEEACNVDDT